MPPSFERTCPPLSFLTAERTGPPDVPALLPANRCSLVGSCHVPPLGEARIRPDTEERARPPSAPLHIPLWASAFQHACLSDSGWSEHTPVINDLTCLCPDMDTGLSGGTGPEDDVVSRTAGALQSYSGPSASARSPTFLVCATCEAVFHYSLDSRFPNDE